jgi:hypothetical protein
MTPEETILLCRYVRACCPQQAMDEYTPDVWCDLLGDLTLTDCREAVRNVAGRQPFVAPAEIRTEVRRLRGGRLEGFQYAPVDGDKDPQVYLAALRAQRAAVADGRREAAPAIEAGEPREVRALISGAFHRG